jgi:predicted nucleotide-binding protein
MGNAMGSTLAISRSEARQKLEQQIGYGRQLLALDINQRDELQTAKARYQQWSDNNSELLGRIFRSDEFEKGYNSIGVTVSWTPKSFNEDLIEYWSDVKVRISKLEDLLERLNSIPEPTVIQDSQRFSPSNRVFVVHGHDDGHKQSVARLLERLGLEPIILHEQPNRGQVIIEKFEEHSDVGFAVILLTPDDVGAARGQASSLQPRARQNVVFELGFFVAKLGRRRICPLYLPGIELPSDLSGMLYVELDDLGHWRTSLAREIKAAGIDIDLNRLA